MKKNYTDLKTIKMSRGYPIGVLGSNTKETVLEQIKTARDWHKGDIDTAIELCDDVYLGEDSEVAVLKASQRKSYGYMTIADLQRICKTDSLLNLQNELLKRDSPLNTAAGREKLKKQVEETIEEMKTREDEEFNRKEYGKQVHHNQKQFNKSKVRKKNKQASKSRKKNR